MPTVVIPPPYRGPTEGASEVEVDGASVRECLEKVDARYAGFLPQVLDDEGRLHRFVKVFVNGQPVDSTELDTAVASDDQVEVLAAIAGG